jgi:hypothetical protein
MMSRLLPWLARQKIMPRWPKKTLMGIISLLNSGSAGIILFVTIKFFTQDIYCKNDSITNRNGELCSAQDVEKGEALKLTGVNSGTKDDVYLKTS